MDWRLKVGIQQLLGRVPGGESGNYALQILRGSHSRELVGRRLMLLAESCGWIAAGGVRVAGARIVEIGTGWDAINALLLSVLGASGVWTFDVSRHLRWARVSRVVGEILAQADGIADHAGVPREAVRERAARLAAARGLEEVLEAASIVYRAPVNAVRTGLAAASADLVYSHAVLEHVDLATLRQLDREAARIVRPGGAIYHAVDPHDHCADADRSLCRVHFLRYSDRFWNTFVQSPISRHNRMREREFLDVFAADGFEVLALRHEVDADSLRALADLPLDRRFVRFTPEELAVTHFEIILRPGPAMAAAVGDVA